MSKVTSSRFLQAMHLSGRLTGSGMPTAAGVRDEEEAKASGNGEDRGCPSYPATAGRHIPQGVMPAEICGGQATLDYNGGGVSNYGERANMALEEGLHWNASDDAL